MKPELEAALVKLLEGVDKLGAAAWDEAPLVLKDLLTAGLIDFSVGLVVGVILLVIATILIRQAHKYAHKTHYYGDADVGCAIMGILTGVAGITVTPIMLVNLLTIIYAPRAYLLEQVGRLLK